MRHQPGMLELLPIEHGLCNPLVSVLFVVTTLSTINILFTMQRYKCYMWEISVMLNPVGVLYIEVVTNFPPKVYRGPLQEILLGSLRLHCSSFCRSVQQTVESICP